MRITGFLPESYQDWEEGLASVIFIGLCDYRCPSCHARKLLDGQEQNPDQILDRLRRKKDYIPRVVVTGGEPIVDAGLSDFLKKIRDIGIRIKLDTNGTNTTTLSNLISQNLVDYVAMDIKGPPALYPIITGAPLNPERIKANMERAVDIIQQAQGYELRTTIFPVQSNGTSSLRWIAEEEVRDMVKWLRTIKRAREGEHYLQRFVARNEDEMIDPRFSKTKLPLEYHTTPNATLERMQKVGREEGYKFALRN